VAICDSNVHDIIMGDKILNNNEECHSTQSINYEDCKAHLKESCTGCKYWYENINIKK